MQTMTNTHPDTSRLTLLDCTLRDGGYYNQWDFDRSLVSEYLRAMDDSGVDIVEIGFRAMRAEGFHGPYAFSTDDFLRTLPALRRARLGVMCNAKDLLTLGGADSRRGVDLAFAPSERSPVRVVRIAAHASEVEACRGACSRLRDLGYTVGFNIMQAGGKTPEQMRALAATVQSWNVVDALYFADSLGSMTPASVRETVAVIRAGWKGPIGFHAHDNTASGLANALAAYEAGADWIDGTVLGMGRGAGNAQTEYLLAEFARRGAERFRPEAMLPILEGGFGDLKRTHNWGANLLYYMGAVRGVHPTYVQQMLTTDRYSADDVESAIRALGERGGSSYSASSLEAATIACYTNDRGEWAAPRLAQSATGKRVALLVAATPGLARHAEGVESLVRRLKPCVFALNEPEAISPELIDYTVACHPMRVVRLAQREHERPIAMPQTRRDTLPLAAGAESLAVATSQVRHSARRLIAPVGAIPAGAVESLRAAFEVCDYGLRIEPGSLRFHERGCAAPSTGVGPYALCAAAASGADTILLAGFDGHGPGDERTRAMNAAFDLFQRAAPGVRVVAITPTEYGVEQGSVYDDALLA